MAKKFVPSGVMPALVTPFSRDGDIIENGFKDVIEYTISKGATGVVPAGTTGEFSYMRTEERKKLFKLAVEFVDGRVPIIAGTGQHSTKATVELTKYAADVGCDAALVISPYYLKPTDKGYFEHYATVARKGDLPVVMYNIPQCTFGVIPPNVIEDLAEIENIVGVKDSSGHIGYHVEIIQKLKGKLPVLIGHDECVLSAFAAGASAAILASGNIIPHIWLDVMKHVQDGNFTQARKLQHLAQPLTRIITRNGGAPPVKAALRMMGIKAGYCRMPLNSGGTLTRELKEEIRIELEKLSLIEKLSHAPIIEEVNVIETLGNLGFNVMMERDVKTASGASDTISVGLVTGPKKSAVGRAFVRLLMNPRIGHEALTVILEPNLPVKPSSIMLPLRRIESMRQASLFYGPVQSGAAKAVASFIADSKIPDNILADNVAIMILDVDLNSLERRDVTAATYRAVTNALGKVWR